VPRRFQALRSRDFELPSFRSQKVKFQPATVSSLLLLDIGASILFVLRERGIPLYARIWEIRSTSLECGATAQYLADDACGNWIVRFFSRQRVNSRLAKALNAHGGNRRYVLARA
jgi:hypothetical protein